MKVRRIIRVARSTSGKPLDSRTGFEVGNSLGQFLPSGVGMIELALQAGFVAPILLDRGEAGAEERRTVWPGVLE